MTNFHLSCFSFVIAFSIIIVIPAFSQIPDFSNVPIVRDGDSLNITSLINNGIRMSKGKVIAWFPKDSLSEKRMNEIIDTLNIGVIGAEKFINAPLSWQVQQEDDSYTYYFRTDSFISHASFAGFVSISFWRIKTGKAPWLHEAIHEMLNTKAGNFTNYSREENLANRSLWLSEGLPEYISIKVSQQYNLAHFDVFSDSNIPFEKIDSICKEAVRNYERSAYILSSIGRKGIMPELFSKDRRSYAPLFYQCSCSFVKYLVEQYGIDHLLNSISAFPREHEELEKQIGTSLEVVKRSWIEKMKFD